MHRHESPVLAGWSVALLVAAWAIWGLGLFASPMDPAVGDQADLNSRIDVTIGVVLPYYLGCVAGCSSHRWQR